MYAHILIATDGSDLADRALGHAIAVAKALNSDVTVVTVSESAAMIGAYADGFYAIDQNELTAGQDEAARALLDKAETKAKAAGVAVKTIHVKDSFPAEGIIATAESLGADLIVMGSHGRRGLGRLLLGSQTNNVLAHTKTPVLVTR